MTQIKTNKDLVSLIDLKINSAASMIRGTINVYISKLDNIQKEK